MHVQLVMIMHDDDGNGNGGVGGTDGFDGVDGVDGGVKYNYNNVYYFQV